MVLSVEHLGCALDLVSDFILVAEAPLSLSPLSLSPSCSSSPFIRSYPSSPSFPPPDDDTCATNFHDQETCKCERTYFNNVMFANLSLCNFLHYNINTETNQREDVRELATKKKRKEVAQKLNANVRGMICGEEGKIECRVALRNAFGSEIHFYASGSILDDVHIFKLRFTSMDEVDVLKNFFYDTKLFMSIVEAGPDDGTFEWRHILTNKFVRETYHYLSPTLDKFDAKERLNDLERRDMWESLQKCKQTRDPVPHLGEDRVSTFPAVLNYLHTDSYTKRDVFGLVIWDFNKARNERNRMVDITSFFEEAPMMMGTLEYKGGQIYVLHCNRKAAQRYGLEEIPKHTNLGSLRGVTETKLQFYRGVMEDSRHIGKPVVNCYQSTNENDELVWYQSIVSILKYDKENDVSHHAYCVCDMTAQKNAEIDLEKHKHSLEETIQLQDLRFHSLVSNAPNIILSINRSGIIHYANRSFHHEDKQSMIGKAIQLLVCEGAELMNKIRILFETQQSFHMEVKLLDSDLWLNINAGIMAQDLATVVATDITAQKLMAESMVHALSIRSRFLANMSHEVRTPLSGIIGMSRILMDSELTIDQAECVSTIQNCGEQLLSVINDVLDYTKLEATGLKLDNAEFSLHHCVEESVYAILPAALKKSIELVIDIDHSVPDKVMGDTIRVQQVLINLLNNAVKFTDSGYIMVTLNGSELDGTGLWKFYFSIKDTGCGIPQDKQSKLFQMFSQVDSSATRRYGGTGIGLALAKKFSEMMNGDVTMQSSGVPGEGSTFFFNLSAALVPFSCVLSPPPTSSHPHWFIGSTNIFILEKLPIASVVLKKKLVGMGFISVQICTSPNTEETFDGIRKYVAAQSHTVPSIVFCNVDFIACGNKHSLFDHSNAALVVMAYMRPANLTENYPNHEYLRKPIKHNSLTRVLKDIWGRLNHVKRQPSVCSPSIVKRPIYPLDILVVEDNEVNQRVVKRVFQHLGYTNNIAVANHGQEALDMIEKNGLPDVILMDVQMPVLDGVETTKIIRSKYKTDRPYIVSMTADAFPEDRQNCLDAGMNDFLTKPIRIEQVQAALTKCYQLKELLKITRN